MHLKGSSDLSSMLSLLDGEIMKEGEGGRKERRRVITVTPLHGWNSDGGESEREQTEALMSEGFISSVILRGPSTVIGRFQPYLTCHWTVSTIPYLSLDDFNHTSLVIG